MARIAIVLSALTAGLVLAASPMVSATSPGYGQVPAQGANLLPLAMCADREEMIADLDRQFSETPMAVGQVDGNAVIEILVSDLGSWTILATGTDGTSCIVSTGEGFESAMPLSGADA